MNLIACDSTRANITGTYPNSWDRTYPTPINADSLFSNQDFYTTCPLCISNHTAAPCNFCSYPSAVTVATSVTATQVGSSMVILTGSASSSNHISYHIFSQMSGTAVSMAIQAGTRDTLTNVSPGTYVFKYKAIDSYWNTDSSTVSITVSAARDSIKIQFDTLTTLYGNSIIQSNFIQMRGDPSIHVITATGGNNNSITVSSIATANWTSLWGYGAKAGGSIPTHFFTNADTALSQVWINAATAYTSGVYQIKVSGLHPSSTYRIQLSASASYDAFNGMPCLGSYQWFGATASAADTLNAQPSGVANTTSGLTWSSVQPDTSGQLFLAFNAANTSQTAGFLGAITITENSGSGMAAKPKADSGHVVAILSDSSGSGGSLKDVILYPNPAKGQIFIHLGNGLEKGTIITLYKVNGQVVTRVPVKGPDHVLTLDSVTPGVYIIWVSNGVRNVTRKIIKR
jgi:hypothetical protein